MNGNGNGLSLSGTPIGYYPTPIYRSPVIAHVSDPFMGNGTPLGNYLTGNTPVHADMNGSFLALLNSSPDSANMHFIPTQIGTPNNCIKMSNQGETVSQIDINTNEEIIDRQFDQTEDLRLESFQPCQKLDTELVNLPRVAYVDKILQLTNSDIAQLESYRNLLHRRAKDVSNCPEGRLIQRRGSEKCSQDQMLAKDCYLLHMLVKGELTAETEQIFRKENSYTSERSKSLAATESPCLANDLSEMQSEILNLKQ